MGEGRGDAGLVPLAEAYIKKNVWGNPRSLKRFMRVTFKEPVAVDRGVKFENVADRQLEFVMRNCYFHDSGNSVGLQGCRKATITNNHFVRIGASLAIQTASWWWEGSTANNVTIADNVFLDAAYKHFRDKRKNLACISIHNGTLKHIPLSAESTVYPNENIEIRNNLIDGSAAAGIRVSNARNVRIVDNVLKNFQKGTPHVKPSPWAVQGGVSITGCRGITIAGNTVDTCADRAIQCRDVADVEITNNEFSGIEGSRNKADAPTVIYLSDGRNVRAVGNRVDSSNARQTLLLEHCLSGD